MIYYCMERANTISQALPALNKLPYIDGISWDDFLDKLSPIDDGILVLGLNICGKAVHCLSINNCILIFRLAEKIDSIMCEDMLIAARALSLGHEALSGARIFCAIALSDYYDKPYTNNRVPIMGIKSLLPYLKSRKPAKSGFDLEAYLHGECCQLPEDADAFSPIISKWAQKTIDGWQSDALKLASSLVKQGYPMYITDNLDCALKYCSSRGFNYRALVSSANNLPEGIALSPISEEAKSDISILCWHEDLRWVGKWKCSAAYPDRPELYLEMLKSSSKGLIVYMPQSMALMASYRALIDCGLQNLIL